jgi:hypothetical protein
MTIPDSPAWDRLPHDPLGFFGLTGGFDRRDLKRRYNQLIRQFKPEKFPEQFQRIRAAYEQLDLQIRYGTRAAAASRYGEQYQWPTDAQAKTDGRPNDGRKSTQSRVSLIPSESTASRHAAPLHERIHREPLASIYRDLGDRPHKSPFDYYALAVLADVIDCRDGLRFVEWILQGLAVHRGDPGLLRLLQELVHAPASPKQAQAILISCSTVLPEELFFPLTEPLWQSLLRHQDASRFQSTLQQCEASLSGISIDSRLAFYIQMLKSALWHADEEWSDRAIAFIDENFDRIPPSFDYDIEILSALRAYVRARPAFIAANPMRRKLDDALRTYFSEDQSTGDRAILECQVLLTQDTMSLRAAFLPLEDPAYGPFYHLWSWVSYDVAERNVEAPAVLDVELWQSRTKMLLDQLVRQTENSRLGVAWYGTSFIFYCALILTCLFTAIIGASFVGIALSRVRNELIGVLLPLATAPAIIALFVWLYYRVLKTRIRNRYLHYFAGRCYREQWQPEILSFLARSQVPYHTFAQMLAASMTADASTSTWIHYHVTKDYALAMFSVAQLFLV